MIGKVGGRLGHVAAVAGRADAAAPAGPPCVRRRRRAGNPVTAATMGGPAGGRRKYTAVHYPREGAVRHQPSARLGGRANESGASRAPAAILCPAALCAGMAPLEPPPVSQAGSPTDWGELVQGPETNARHPKCRWPPAAGRGETAGPGARPLPSGPSRQGEQGKKVDGSAGAVIDCFFVCFASRSRFWPP